MAAGDIIIPDNTITPELLDKIAAEVQNRILSTSKDPGQYEEVDSLTGITSIPVFQQSGSTYKLVRVLLSILKGVDGKEVHLQSTDTHLQWRWTDGMWENLVAWADLKGDPGDTPVFRTSSFGIEWKYESEDETEWKELVTFEVLKLKFSDLTEENIAEFWRGVPDDIMAEFQKPATDAAAEVREQMVQISQDVNRVITETNTAKDAAITAAGNAKSVSDHPGYIGTDYHVYTWDYATGAYNKTDTVLRPEGFSIYRTYQSITAMNADKVNVEEGKFVLINTGSVDDEDTAKLYVKGATDFEYLVDMSGAIGFTGKTPQITIGTVMVGSSASASLSPDGVDDDGNPKFKLNLVIVAGPQGLMPTIEMGTTTTGQPGTDVIATLTPNGQTSDGRDKYLLNLTIPQGMPGSGNVSAVGTGLVAGKSYLFVPGEEDSTDGAFVEYVVPDNFPEAPEDGKTYGRKDGAWSEVVESEEGKGLSTNDFTNAYKDKLSKINFTPTLDHDPGGGDLTYTDEEGEHLFLIGDQVRVSDAEKGYVFWQLYDITVDNKAIWKKAGSGGDMQLTEKLTITLTSNQAQPDAKLNGLIVHVKYGDNDTPLTWSGTAMTTEIPMNMTYRIEFPALAGYAAPETEEYIALAGNTRTVNVSYNTTILTINVSGNQTDKSDLNNLQITLSGSFNKILTYAGQPLVVNVPTSQQLVITPAQIEGYATVAAITKTPVASAESVSFAYNTTIMSITLSSNQGTDATLNAGTNVVVKCGAINKTLTWKGATLTQKIPTGQAYTITPAALSGYKTPATKTGTASGVNMSETMQYQTEVVTVTVTVNTDNSISCSGQKVTINGTEYTYSSPITVKIPFGTSYSVSVNSKAGFTPPDAQSFTANQATRAVTMTYLEIKRGVFILDMDGNLVKRSDWNTSNNSKSVGVAVLTDNCKFVISKVQAANMTWGTYGTEVSGVATTTNTAAAKQDYAGHSNTIAIITIYGSEAPAASYCNMFKFPDKRLACLGSCGQWQEAYNNKAEVDACMSLIGGDAIATDAYHWTSTQYSSTRAWRLYWSNGDVTNGSKSSSYRVRAFAAL